MSKKHPLKKMRLSREEILKIARLANLRLSDEEIVRFQRQLSETLNYIEVLDELDTAGVSPTSQITGLKNLTREDVRKPSLFQEQALSGAKSKFKGFFKVKAVIER